MANKSDTIVIEGSLIQALSLLTFPTLLAQTAQTLGWIGEIYFIGQLGPEAAAAIGAVGQVGWILMVLTMMVSVGATTMTAQRWGAGDTLGAKTVTISAVQQSIFFGIVAMFIWFGRSILWHWINISASVEKLATVYFVVAIFSFPLMSISISLMAVFRGIGNTVTPMWVTFLGVFIQLLLNAVFIPIWGILGAAVALVVSRLVILFLMITSLWRSSLSLPTTRLLNWHPDFHRELLTLGVPVGLQSLLWSLSSIIYFAILARTPNSTSALAALTIGLRIEALAFMPGIAFSTAAQTLVGQNIGAGQFDRAKSGAWQAACWCVSVMTLMAIVIFIFANWMAGKFADEKFTIHYIATYLKINALSEPFIALSMTLSGALRGAGDTKKPAIVNIATLYGLRLPVTYWLCVLQGNDAITAWWTMSLSNIVSGIWMVLLFIKFASQKNF